MAHTMMLPIEVLCLATVQSPHAATQIGFGCFEQQMVVIAHQAEGITAPVLLEDLLPEEGKKTVAVGVIEEDRLLGITPRRDMMERPRIVQP